ncbi:hypothetical protein GCM10027024_10630 [Microbacterium insulae]
MQKVVVTTVLALAITTIAAFHSQRCDDVGTWSSNCGISNSGTSVDISAGEGGTGSAPSSPDTGWSPPRDTAAPPASPESAPEPEECGPLGCRGNYTVVTVPDVTMADLASFRPATPRLAGEPGGFAIAGMPANLVAAASVEEIPGTVLGWDVVVRFTPVAFEFSHGDGTSAVHPTGGATWQQLGRAQFTPTGTSHVYRERGIHSVNVSVRYTAAVDFGSGTWRPVPGYITATSGGYRVQVVEVRTALVDRTCIEDPLGPGC